ncbi:MAG TPA: MASE3 domain-containing protein [Gallionella sp.]|nr:MASE3 domain-containing protein [Gallionella sp.]
MDANALRVPVNNPAEASLRRNLWLVAALSLIFLLIWLIPTPDAVRGIANYLPIHMAVEVFSIIVAMLIFGVTWNAYSSERAGNVVFIACAMLAVGLIDFVHTLSFKGMPEFITPSGPEKAINFWLAARFLAALALLVVAVRPWTPLRSPRLKYALLAGSLAVTSLVCWVALFHQDVLPHTFIEGKGLTPLKIAAEYLIVAMLVVPAILFYRQAQRGVSYDATALFAATAISILSELSFTLYKDVTDIFNLFGHLYKVIAYLYIYRAMFVANVREPYQRLFAAQQALHEHEAHLEELVRQRTAELEQRNRLLEAANADLESFSYSVSHDLRAPLRAIDGFSNILQEDYAPRLDDEGKRLLGVVSDNAEKMGQLIDDILAFSRAGRLELQLGELDMCNLVQDVWRGLEPQRAGRVIEFRLAELPAACGDHAAMRQVFQNLLSNAIKFTRGREPAVVEVGCESSATGNIYYVRDNGAGFDMACADKLFGVFQRLHGVQEFEGTGIGLAIVRRFIEKLGGRVWADAKVGEGATFRFTLPQCERCAVEMEAGNGTR